MANKKPKKSDKVSKPVEKVKAETKTKSEKVVTAKVKGATETKTTKKVVKKKSSSKPKVIASGLSASGILESQPMKGFFKKKGDVDENVLTIFKKPRLYNLLGSLIGEVIGTMFLTIFMMTMGVYQPLYAIFIYIAVTAAITGLSGAHLNPLITAGMMASRRVSAIRGIIYILGQILGAWFGLLIVNAARLAAGSEAELPTMIAIGDGQFWPVTIIEMVGSLIFAFFFARATVYKRSTLTYAIMVGAGYLFASLTVIMISTKYFTLQNNFMMNPAIALMYQILPTGADNFGQLMTNLALALCTYAVLPMLGGVIGFYLSDFTQRLAGDPRK
ncbi:MAG: aquaporin [Candidatus Saccharibacteria bacterium]|nr:aquaporin [Candidatus Saccharibacteria bacterium]